MFFSSFQALPLLGFLIPLPVACLPIVDVPVHIVTGMPMTVGLGMRMAITMGTKKHITGIAHGYSHGHAHYILAVPMTLSMGTITISGWTDLEEEQPSQKKLDQGHLGMSDPLKLEF